MGSSVITSDSIVLDTSIGGLCVAVNDTVPGVSMKQVVRRFITLLLWSILLRCWWWLWFFRCNVRCVWSLCRAGPVVTCCWLSSWILYVCSSFPWLYSWYVPHINCCSGQREFFKLPDSRYLKLQIFSTEEVNVHCHNHRPGGSVWCWDFASLAFGNTAPPPTKQHLHRILAEALIKLTCRPVKPWFYYEVIPSPLIIFQHALFTFFVNM